MTTTRVTKVSTIRTSAFVQPHKACAGQWADECAICSGDLDPVRKSNADKVRITAAKCW